MLRPGKGGAVSHQLDIDGMLEKLLLLQHWTYGRENSADSVVAAQLTTAVTSKRIGTGVG